MTAWPLGALIVDTEVLESVSALLDLRQPNKEAVESVAAEIGRHFDLESRAAPFECVVDSATGVGKTYIFAGAMEYLARARGIRNFALIAPSRVILDKTINQFTLGHEKAIVSDLSMPLTVVTADNFNSPNVATEMADDSRVKLYVFTVQAILQPKSKADRKTHEFQEGLGAAFYQQLQETQDLVVFADEHHSYYGSQFSAAIRDLNPWVLIGLTATPHPKTPESLIVYRYPLAAAIADQYVKTPVIVGRRDDKKDPRTKLLDGVALLETKRAIAERYAQVNGKPRVNPIMLVVARDIGEAEAWAEIVRGDDFKDGMYAEYVLIIHSRAVKAENEEQELRRLQDVEHPDSPIRVVISVQMLKEGWDVKNVYVLLSTQPSLSDLLTEQVLGRGLRLPWGKYTTVQMLDTLEVIAHDRFDDLLKRKGVLSEEFVNYRTRAIVRTNALGETVVVRESIEVKPVVATSTAPITIASGTETGMATEAATESPAEPVAGNITLTDFDSRASTGEAEQARMFTEVAPSRAIAVPLVRQEELENPFSLSDITDLEPFRDLGRRLHVDPEDTLRRTVVGAKVIVDPSGIKRIELVTSQAVDPVQASGFTLTEDELRSQLTQAILGSPVVASIRDADGSQRRAAKRVLDAFFEGLDGSADELLSAYLERATSRLIAQIMAESRRFSQAPKYRQTVKMHRVAKVRANPRPITENRHGVFQRAQAYSGWTRSVYPIEWFSSGPERDLANLLDDANDVGTWLRLQVGELPILWADGKHRYNADFIVIETSGDRWVVEVKADNQMTNDEVLAKREAAKRWVNAVNDSGQVHDTWHYVLVAQRDIHDVKGSWSALRRLGK
jgi:type III restriction enzyme